MTAQIGEKLHHEGGELHMCSVPLADYFALAGIESGFQANSTALWRGYVGTWEIRDGRLYLIELTGTLQDGTAATVETFFPNYPDRAFAHWYSGRLRVPEGNILKYVHGGFLSIYERDLFIAIDKGVVTETRVQHNGISSDPEETEDGYGVRAMTTFAPTAPAKETES